jgi:uncharacterized C2H2 Zn-finger protein
MKCLEYPIFNISKKGRYICACDEWFETLEDALYHLENGGIENYCENGIKYIGTNEAPDLFECICGKQLSRYDIFELHYKYCKTTCMTECIRKKNSYCAVCDLQCASVASYDIHCQTNKHQKNTTNNTKLDLMCNNCNIVFKSQADIARHVNTSKHKKLVKSGTILPKEKLPLECSICNIKVLSQSQIRAHLNTNKHKKLTSIKQVC